ncbi:LVIVD repeat-containing protein [Mucilaginibacter myungsuensis]|uniref:LVIVD repeat-containing protein n=1 Tax=Mucilaginibacter myungsuensis TaxID=649104 RepID=A0A929KXE1_9SPHI|nr:hypothetical protein [Mucilaginibacter myungsuensis]MBE9662245.1 hypothetical protein [Mucilaginibacter myungsuensis]MDN3599319.1 hypothetical protein [Mucilaginibacter myungsuensis]
MKPYHLLLLLVLISGCRRDEQDPQTNYFPVLLSRESLERSITFHGPVPIEIPAKVYYKDNFILISERFKGVHVIDNTDPAKPVNRGYINVPGCVDMAVKGNVLYVDNAVDMLAIDLSSIGNTVINVLSRTKNAFPELTPPDGGSVPDKYKPENRPPNTILVGWEK